MNVEGWGALLVSLFAGLALAASAGLRAFLPLLALAVGARMGLVTLDTRFAFLASDMSLIGLALATVLEIAGDKIPLVDHALDVAGTVVRPAAGFVSGMALLKDLPEPVSAAVSLVLAAIALGTHLGHAKTRVGSTVLTAGVANPVISVFEDLASGLLAVCAVLIPLVGLVLALVFFYLVWRLARGLSRWGLPGRGGR